MKHCGADGNISGSMGLSAVDAQQPIAADRPQAAGG